MFSQSEITEVSSQRIDNIRNQLAVLAMDSPGLNDQAKTDINVSNITLSNFILGISNTHDVNINISKELDAITISNNNFSNVKVSDLLVFLCKEYNLIIEFTGSILSVKKYVPPKELPQERVIPVTFNAENDHISIDAKNDALFDVFRRITDESAKNLVFTPGMENKVISAYINDMPFDTAMNTLALSNNLYVEKTDAGFYMFEEPNTNQGHSSARLKSAQNQNYEVLDYANKLLKVDFNNTPIASIINDIGHDLNLNIFTATPLDKAGTVTFKTTSISFDDLLIKIFESHAPSNSNPTGETPNSTNGNINRPDQNSAHRSSTSSSENFTFKKEGDVYFFGTEDQLSVRKVEVIHLMHRSVELLSDPEGGNSRSRTVGRSLGNSYGDYNRSFNSGINQSSFNSGSINRNNNRIQNGGRSSLNNSNSGSGDSQTIDEIIPPEIAEDLDIQVDKELNRLYVTGSAAKIQRLREFITYIDKTVPVVLIEVMFVEVSRNNTIESGVSWGIGEQPAETRGSIFPTTDFTLGANTINRVINGFNGFDRLNLGKVVPNFFATVKAMESNGDLKIRSTPKLSTLNGHRATFSNGETSYYTVTQRNIYGTDNPQTSEITNYEPIDAELGLTIKPLVSGDGQVTLDIFVIQSSFGDRIDENAPPDISSREFSSIIRVQDQDIVVLGGLEEQRRSNSGSGVPFLARVPVVKWLFSSRKREAQKAKLTVFIKPTIIY